MPASELDQQGIDVIRGLAMDAVQRANSGHPGTPMALAPLAHVLFTRIMRYDASVPEWPDRDRFVLSNGHASMLLYSLLYLTGFGLELDDLRAFRQWESRTPGHPEYRHSPGIEVTTGPLGQGFANSVGIALAEANLRERYGPEVCDHHTFVIAGDGCFEEGVSHEAASLAGHLGLGRLVCVYDDNHITIDGPTELAYSDNVPERFEAYGWEVVPLGEEANDLDALEAGLRSAMRDAERPSVVILRSHIGWPSPKYTDTAHAHGSPLGEDEVRAVKAILGLPADETFWVPDEVLAYYREVGERGRADREAWDARHAALREREPQLAEEFDACLEQRGLAGWETKLPSWSAGDPIATRVASNQVLDAIVDVVPGIVAGGADLTGNTGTELKNEGRHRDPSVPWPSDPLRDPRVRDGRDHERDGGLEPAPRRRDLLRVLATTCAARRGSPPSLGTRPRSCWTHDSVGLGEDGPTHQPIEQLAAFRAMPGMRVIRPADPNEVAQAWRVHIESGGGPTALDPDPTEGPDPRRHRRARPRGGVPRRVHARRRRRRRARPRARRHRV